MPIMNVYFTQSPLKYIIFYIFRENFCRYSEVTYCYE